MAGPARLNWRPFVVASELPDLPMLRQQFMPSASAAPSSAQKGDATRIVALVEEALNITC